LDDLDDTAFQIESVDFPGYYLMVKGIDGDQDPNDYVQDGKRSVYIAKVNPTYKYKDLASLWRICTTDTPLDPNKWRKTKFLSHQIRNLAFNEELILER
jgi:hypothetical protein